MTRETMSTGDISVVITGMGAVTPIGIGVAPFWSALLAGQCGIRELRRFDATALPFTRGGEIPDFAPPQACADAREADPATQFMLGAADEALREAGLSDGVAVPDEVGIVLATNFGGIVSGEAFLQHAPAANGTTARALSEYAFASAADRIAQTWNLCGPRTVLSLSCSSGAAAIGYGVSLIRAGRAQVIVAGGFDALSRFCWSGLGALRTMTRDTVRPFDRRRDGTIFSEGAGALVLESRAHAAARGAQILAGVAGYGLNNNAHHMTAPPKDSAGTVEVMRMALRDAGLRPEDIDHVNAHGTATKYNDIAEAEAMRQVFGARAGSIPVTANKSALGHMLGAAGIVEAIVSALSLRDQYIPPTLHCEEPDPACAVDIVTGAPRAAALRAVMSNSAGIGGNNASLILTREVSP